MYSRLLPVIALIAAVLLLSPSAAGAFEVRPAIFDLPLSAGSSTEREIVVKNTDAKPVVLYFTVQPFEAGGGGRPKFLDPRSARGLPEWIRLSRPNMTLAPGEEASVKLRIDVPEGTPPGGRYASIFTTEAAGKGGTIGAARRIATLVLAAVDADRAPAMMRLVSLAERRGTETTGLRQWLGFSSRGTLEARVENRGATHGVAAVRVDADAWGIVGREGASMEKSVRLLPGESRTLSLEWSARSPIAITRIGVRMNGSAVGGFGGWGLRVRPVGALALAAFAVLIGVAIRRLRRR